MVEQPSSQGAPRHAGTPSGIHGDDVERVAEDHGGTHRHGPGCGHGNAAHGDHLQVLQEGKNKNWRTGQA